MKPSHHSAARRVLGLAIPLLCIAAGLYAFVNSSYESQADAAQSGVPILLPEETKHLKNARQLTFGGQNAEAYFSADDKTLIFQHQGQGVPCDQIYTMPVGNLGDPPATP